MIDDAVTMRLLVNNAVWSELIEAANPSAAEPLSSMESIGRRGLGLTHRRPEKQSAHKSVLRTES